MKPDNKAKSVLDRLYYATLSTVDLKDNPWNSSVYYAYDEDYNVYWGSHLGSQRSQNIRANHKAFIVVYDSTVQRGDGERVYIQAQVEELQPDKPVHLFKVTPEHIWMNRESERDGQYIDVRVDEAT